MDQSLTFVPVKYPFNHGPCCSPFHGAERIGQGARQTVRFSNHLYALDGDGLQWRALKYAPELGKSQRVFPRPSAEAEPTLDCASEHGHKGSDARFGGHLVPELDLSRRKSQLLVKSSLLNPYFRICLCLMGEYPRYEAYT